MSKVKRQNKAKEKRGWQGEKNSQNTKCYQKEGEETKRGRMESKIVNRKEGCEEDIQRRKK